MERTLARFAYDRQQESTGQRLTPRNSGGRCAAGGSTMAPAGIGRLLTTDEVAARAGVSRPTVIKAIEGGEISGAWRVGRTYGVPEASAAAFATAWDARRKAEEKARKERMREAKRAGR
jgi:excisionase family DNA binding protein